MARALDTPPFVPPNSNALPLLLASVTPRLPALTAALFLPSAVFCDDLVLVTLFTPAVGVFVLRLVDASALAPASTAFKAPVPRRAPSSSPTARSPIATRTRTDASARSPTIASERARDPSRDEPARGRRPHESTPTRIINQSLFDVVPRRRSPTRRLHAARERQT